MSRPRDVVLQVRCDSEKPSKQKEAARAACEIFINQLREQVGHDIEHTIPLDGVALVRISDQDAIDYLKQFKLLIVQSMSKVKKGDE